MRSSQLWLTRSLVVLGAGIFLAPNLSAQSLLNDPDWVERHLQTDAASEESTASEFSVFSGQGTSTKPDFLTLLHPEFEQPAASVNHRLQLAPQVRELLMLMEDDPVDAQEQLKRLEPRLKMEDRALLRIVLLLRLERPRTARVLAESFLLELPDDPRTPLVHLLRNRALLALDEPIALDGRLEEQVLRTLPARYQQELLEALSADADARKLPLAALGYRLNLLANLETASTADEQQVLEQLLEIVPAVRQVQQNHRLVLNGLKGDRSLPRQAVGDRQQHVRLNHSEVFALKRRIEFECVEQGHFKMA